MERSKLMYGGGIHYRNTPAILIFALTAAAHPLGNLSVNRFARMQPGERGVEVTYVLDLGEMPVFELMSAWHVDRTALERAAPAHVNEWLSRLEFRENGAALEPGLESAQFHAENSPGDLAALRATLRLFVPAKGGRFEFADHNYAARPGWREIVIVPGPGAEITRASNGGADASAELRAIPEDRPPLDDASAWMEWRPAPGLVSQAAPPVIAPRAKAAPTAPVSAISTRIAAAPANSRKSSQNDAISSILRRKAITLPVFAALLALAFWFGALHALEPGHGKTMVAAYLVGSRGTPRHAALLGLSVTFTHTASVFLLGIATLFVSRYVMPDRISRVLGVASGISIVWIGALLLWRRIRSLRMANAAHEHHHACAGDHDHDHDHEHAHVHLHAHDHGQDHPHAHPHGHPHPHDHAHPPHGHAHAHAEHALNPRAGAFTHTHDGHTHTHVVPEGEVSVRSLIALGASGGLVPCPSALVLLLTAVSLGRTGLGLVLLCAFSAGLAIVLTATGLVVLYAKRLIPESRRTNHPAVRYLPVFSAAAIVIIGAVMTGVSLGWIPANRLTG